MVSDPVADMLTRIRNASRADHSTVAVPGAKMQVEIARVLKQEGYEIYQEATALSRDQPPQSWDWEQRQVKSWDVKDLPFGEAGPVRVVIAEESWKQNRYHGGNKTMVQEHRHWRWIADQSLDGYPAQTIWQIGHQRWGVENHAFNELTQHYHLTHCPHHHPLAIIVWLLFLAMSFNLFELFVRLNGKLWRQIYADVDSSLFPFENTAAKMSLKMEAWRSLMSDVVPPRSLKKPVQAGAGG